jgi:hypothetical protein
MICTVIRAPTGIPYCLVRDCCSVAKISSCGKKQLVRYLADQGWFVSTRIPNPPTKKKKRGKNYQLFYLLSFFLLYILQIENYFIFEQVLYPGFGIRKIFYLGSCTRIQRSKKHRIRIRNSGSKGNYFTCGIVF